jgi:hypothetical protein
MYNMWICYNCCSNNSDINTHGGMMEAFKKWWLETYKCIPDPISDWSDREDIAFREEYEACYETWKAALEWVLDERVRIEYEKTYKDGFGFYDIASLIDTMKSIKKELKYERYN